MKLVHVASSEYDFYIGREDSRINEKESILHNPFKSDGFGGKPWAVELFREYLTNQLRTGKIKRKTISNLQHKTVGCWCHGDVCHGHSIQQFAEDTTPKAKVWLQRNSFLGYVIVTPDGSAKFRRCLKNIQSAKYGHSSILFGFNGGSLYPLFEAKSNMFGITSWHPHVEYRANFRS